MMTIKMPMMIKATVIEVVVVRKVMMVVLAVEVMELMVKLG